MSNAMDNLFASRVISTETCVNMSNLVKVMEMKFQGAVTDRDVFNVMTDLLVSLHGDVVEELGGKRKPYHETMVTIVKDFNK